MDDKELEAQVRRKYGSAVFGKEHETWNEMRIPSSVIAGGAALITGFVFGSMFHTTKVQARNHMAAHIEQVFEIPTPRGKWLHSWIFLRQFCCRRA
jgi:hypothetical protein